MLLRDEIVEAHIDFKEGGVEWRRRPIVRTQRCALGAEAGEEWRCEPQQKVTSSKTEEGGPPAPQPTPRSASHDVNSIVRHPAKPGSAPLFYAFQT